MICAVNLEEGGNYELSSSDLVSDLVPVRGKRRLAGECISCDKSA